VESLDIPAKDWLDDQQAVVARIETMLAHGEDKALSIETGMALATTERRTAAALPPTPQTEAGGVPPATTPDVTGGDVLLKVHLLTFEQGSSRKFWQASCRGRELSVSYGRTGTNGQTILKQFDTPERALKEMDKLVNEKLRKGYVETER
jgi:predicted DNA-binding WGR domain protein